jgi:hypothetical protein
VKAGLEFSSVDPHPKAGMLHGFLSELKVDFTFKNV